VGHAVARRLLALAPKRLVLVALYQDEVTATARSLEPYRGGAAIDTEWGNVFHPTPAAKVDRRAALSDPRLRRLLIDDLVGDLSPGVLERSFLFQLFRRWRPDAVVDCINTATAFAYLDLFHSARELLAAADGGRLSTDQVERHLLTMTMPQLIRHMQILAEAMRRFQTQAYVKIGTSGTGGMGLNIPYTHGEEKPSRVLMSKAALGGAQTLLTFLMGRTPGGLQIAKEIKPTALIAWKEIGYGPIRRGGHDFMLYDCPPEQAVSIKDPANLTPEGDFGAETGEIMEAVYVNTGENGLFAAGDFTLITSLGQMQFVTPEEIAENAVTEILGGNTGKDLVGALDGAVMGSTFRAGFLRQAAINKLEQLEEEHGESIAFEILGPPRMSKLMFEAYLIKRAYKTIPAALKADAKAMASALEKDISQTPKVRQQILSIGLPILLSDGERMLRGPLVKSENAAQGWVDLTSDNMAQWRQRLGSIQAMIETEMGGDTSSRYDRMYPSLRTWSDEETFNVGEIAAWVSTFEDKGKRGKA
jgi:hypothetical protein